MITGAATTTDAAMATPSNEAPTGLILLAGAFNERSVDSSVALTVAVWFKESERFSISPDGKLIIVPLPENDVEEFEAENETRYFVA